MKKIISILLSISVIVCSVFAFAGCSRSNKQSNADIILITDGATISDNGYNQSAWNGIKSFADENNMTCRYYQPSLNENDELDVDIIAKYIALAANDGAKYIVLPGESFAVSAYEIAPTYSDINFLIVDAFPHSASDYAVRLQQNVMCISFDNLQAGFLAGFSSVIDGYTKLGYFGSVSSTTSGNYGAGFVQGAAYAADVLGKPVVLDYADYDSSLLNYDYSFTIKAVYDKIPTDDGNSYYNVKVENGLGSGTYKDGENVTISANAPEKGKKFDHWEVKSNTDGVKDSKVNISSKKSESMNLLVEKCDCTITAVYSDAKTNAVSVEYVADDEKKSDVYYFESNSSANVDAPVAPMGMKFDHWECSDANAIEDANSKTAKINVAETDLTLTPVYVASENPTFTVKVENGTGSGSYLTGDNVKVVADAPKEGYMFKKWENVDNQGLSTGISMENEYCYSTEFEMVDRYSSIVEAMFDDGTQVVFGGGNQLEDSIFTATENFDYSVYGFGYGVDESNKKNCLASIVNDYGNAVKLALSDFAGASIMKADCSNNSIYVTGKSTDANDENVDKYYASVYDMLAKNELNLVNVQSGGDVRKSFNSKCLTLNYWIINEKE